MLRNQYTIEMPYTYDPSHRGCHYLVDGKYRNVGEFIEHAIKFHMGIEDYNSKDTVPFDMGSDIEEIHASVKGPGFSLATIYGEDINAIYDEYFERVASNLWIYAIVENETLVEYRMNATEFRTFLENFGKLVKASNGNKKVRVPNHTHYMTIWLDSHCN